MIEMRDYLKKENIWKDVKILPPIFITCDSRNGMSKFHLKKTIKNKGVV